MAGIVLIVFVYHYQIDWNYAQPAAVGDGLCDHTAARLALLVMLLFGKRQPTLEAVSKKISGKHRLRVKDRK
jgi:hypothetical protein